ncbi:MAG TPA: hypothetical protein VGG39_37595 [Polyangiaceae bacterium]|jgi:hypothetical protein
MRLFVSLLLVAIALMGCPGGGAVVKPPTPAGQIQDSYIEGDFPAGCTAINFDVTVTQGSHLASTKGGLLNGRLTLGALAGFDPTQAMTITIVITRVVGNCAPLAQGDTWVFDEVLTDVGGGAYKAPFSKFTKK